MHDASRGIDEIASYHAHIYYDPGVTSRRAEQLRAAVGNRFAVRLGRWHDTPVGPHSAAMFQIAFETALFASLVPWLMLNHQGLSVLVHPNTLNPRRDHLADGVWIGRTLPLYGEKLETSILKADSAGEPNTPEPARGDERDDTVRH